MIVAHSYSALFIQMCFIYVTSVVGEVLHGFRKNIQSLSLDNRKNLFDSYGMHILHIRDLQNISVYQSGICHSEKIESVIWVNRTP